MRGSNPSFVKAKRGLRGRPPGRRGGGFVDGCALSLDSREPSTAYSVMSPEGELIEGAKLLRTWSAQAAELFALTRAYEMALRSAGHRLY